MMRNTNVTGGSASLALAGAKDTRVELRTSADIKRVERSSLAGWGGYECVYFDGCYTRSSAGAR
jgi:hypothetical protein